MADLKWPPQNVYYAHEHFSSIESVRMCLCIQATVVTERAREMSSGNVRI